MIINLNPVEIVRLNIFIQNNIVLHEGNLKLNLVIMKINFLSCLIDLKIN